jgi:dTDP-4-amino-4,6-dideoxygalactose transaminase
MRKLKLIEPVVGEEEVEAVTEVLRSGWLAEGKKTREFERMVADYVDARYAYATTSCTIALELALRALEIGEGDEVIVSDFSHVASAEVVKTVGAEPVLADVDLRSYNITANEIRKAFSEKTKCVIAVSLLGNPLELDVYEVARKLGIYIIEDAACSLGSMIGCLKVGTVADITCFSFHPRKVITCGMGGMAVTNNLCYAERLVRSRKFGQIVAEDGKITTVDWGTNSQLSDVLGAIGIEQMKKIETIIERRIELAEYYNLLFSQVLRKGVVIPERKFGLRHTFQTYAIYIEKEGLRDKIVLHLKKKNIEAKFGSHALHLHPYLANVRRASSLENSEKLYRNTLALPMCHSMTPKDQERVFEAVMEAM